MGLGRLLILGLLVWVGFVLWRRWQRAGRSASPPAATRVVKCIECGIYVPEADAVAQAGGFVCQAHRAQGRGD